MTKFKKGQRVIAVGTIVSPRGEFSTDHAVVSFSRDDDHDGFAGSAQCAEIALKDLRPTPQASSEIRERENPLLLLPDSEWSSLSSDSQRKIQKWFEIATEHLEQMLRPTSEASIREAVEKLPRYIFAPETDARCRRIPTGSWLMREDVLALLTPSRQGATE